jgi:S-methylmethionine-dependent homocysteine/selenocysteine methylase
MLRRDGLEIFRHRQASKLAKKKERLRFNHSFKTAKLPAMITLLDGGLGQEIQKRSKQSAHPLWSVKIMMDKPEIVQAVEEDFIRAGARILTLNTYAATPTRLARDGDAKWFEPLQNKAFKIALAAREASGEPHGKVRLAGCLPPLQGSYSPETAPPLEDCIEEYQTIVAAQPDVDLFIAETLPTIREGIAAAEAVSGSGKPLMLSFTLSDEQPEAGPSLLRSGEPLAEGLQAVRKLDLEALLLNCSLPETIDRAMPEMKTSPFPFGAYANGFTSVAPLKIGGTVDVLEAREDLGPDAYARIALRWVEAGATVVGGCCEVGPEHIAALRTVLSGAGYKL